MPYKKVASKKISMFGFCDFIVSPEFNLFMFVIQAESPSFCVLQYCNEFRNLLNLIIE